MRKMLIALVGLLLFAGTMQAQDDPAKLAKSAGRALVAYNTDPSGNAAKLEEAQQKIDQALQDAEVQKSVTAWQTKGDIYNTILQKDMAMQMINPKAQVHGDNDALVAFQAFKKAYDLSTKKYEKGDALKGIGEVEGHLVNIGVKKYEANEFEKAYQSFNAAIQAHDLLTSNGQKSAIETDEQYGNQIYVTALSASQSKHSKEALDLYEMLYKKGISRPEIFEGYYNAKLESGDEAGAQTILDEGRKKFPDDTGLLFAEINVYLKKGKLEELVDRLKTAIEKEPGNVGLYVTAGSVYDNLFQREMQAKGPKATEYFNQAKQYYQTAIEKDPKNASANYSIGALYYNQAAVRTKDLEALSNDMSKAGMEKYNLIKKDVDALFDQALPYFQKAEGLDPNDQNTLIALSEIYARKDELTLASEFKKRLETVKGGGKNAAPYFKQ